jgi:hypothetical protein
MKKNTRRENSESDDHARRGEQRDTEINTHIVTAQKEQRIRPEYALHVLVVHGR